MITLIELNLSSNENDLDNVSWWNRKQWWHQFIRRKNQRNFVSRFHWIRQKKKFWLTENDINNQSVSSWSAAKTRTTENYSFPWTKKRKILKSINFDNLSRLAKQDGKKLFSFLFRWVIGHLHQSSNSIWVVNPYFVEYSCKMHELIVCLTFHSCCAMMFALNYKLR